MPASNMKRKQHHLLLPPIFQGIAGRHESGKEQDQGTLPSAKSEDDTSSVNSTVAVIKKKSAKQRRKEQRKKKQLEQSKLKRLQKGQNVIGNRDSNILARSEQNQERLRTRKQ